MGFRIVETGSVQIDALKFAAKLHKPKMTLHSTPPPFNHISRAASSSISNTTILF